MTNLKSMCVASALIVAGVAAGYALTGCATGSSDVALRKVETAHDIAQEICLLAHAFNTRLNVDPQMTINRGKIDSVCDPALEILATASGEAAKAALAELRSQISELMQ